MQRLEHLRTVLMSAFVSCPGVMRLDTNLEDDDVDEHEENTSGIPNLVVGAYILPLKESFGKQNCGNSDKTPDCDSSVIVFGRRTAKASSSKKDSLG